MSSAKITEILDISKASTPAGFVVTILYRHWHTGSSFNASSIFHSPTPLLSVRTYMGPTMTEGWFFEIFDGNLTNPKATLLNLISSTGHPTNFGAFPAGLSDLATLLNTVEIYRSSTYLPPLLCRNSCSKRVAYCSGPTHFDQRRGVGRAAACLPRLAHQHWFSP